MAAFQLIRFAPLILLMAGCSSLISQISNPGGGSGGGVTTFNARTGDVLPAVNDYSFSQLSGQVSVSQQPATTVQAVGTRTANNMLKWVTSNTAADSALTDNGTTISSSEPITASTFTGALAGNATTATTATNLPGGLLGSMPYQSAAGATAMLAGSTSSAIAVLTQTGTGSLSTAPNWNAATGTGLAVFNASPTLTGTANVGAVSATGQFTTALGFTSNRATGTAPIVVTSVTPVANLVVAKHPLEQYCGTTTICSATAQTGGQIVYGSVVLSGGTAVITGITPAFSDTNYSCTGSIKAGALITDGFSIANTSTSSITITGVGTDTISYICVR